MTFPRFLPRAAALLAATLALARLAAQDAPPVPTVVESSGSAEMISSDTEATIIFRDNVVVTGTNLRLSCDYLEVVVRRKGDPGATLGQLDKFRSLLARGNVRIVQGDREAACGRAEVKPEEDKIILSEKPVIVFHGEDGRLEGETITMFRGDRRVIVDRPVSTLPPIKDLGFEKDKATPPAPAAPAKQP